MVAYEYARPIDSHYTDDFQVVSGTVSIKNMEIYIATTQGVSIWSLEEGIQLRAIGNITKGDITAMILDEDQRRLYIADLNGNLV